MVLRIAAMGRRRRAEELLSIASHELRTPLTAMRLHLDGIMREARRGETTLDEKTSRRLAAMARQVARLDRLVADLLEGRSLDALDPSECDLAALIREVTGRLEVAARGAGCDVRIVGDGALIGLWDRVRLEQVITNLLSNALKYGRGAPIELGVRGEGARATFWVRDHGIGISADEAARIFDRWVRTEAADEHADGSGLGLWIVRQIVDAHGGDVWVESAPGKGSTFIVELPLAPVGASAPRS